jgi:hypothetical protein
MLHQGILKGEVSLYCWPPVWLVWNQLYDYWQFLFLFAKQTNPNQSNRRSMVQWYFLFNIPWLHHQQHSKLVFYWQKVEKNLTPTRKGVLSLIVYDFFITIISYLWQLKIVIFLHWCPLLAIPLIWGHG